MTVTVQYYKEYKNTSILHLQWLPCVNDLSHTVFYVLDHSEALDEATADSAYSSLTSMTMTAGAWPQLHQGRSLRRLELDSCTLSEILRLLLLSATEADDPCSELRDRNPGILTRLRTTAVYDLTPGTTNTNTTILLPLQPS